jgi:hypothetical protein
MPWPFEKKNADGTTVTPNANDPANAEGGTPPAEKPIAQIIAESMGEALRPVVEGQAAINARLEKVETATARPARPEAESAQPQRISIFDDEQGALTQAMAPLAAQTLTIEAKMIRNEVQAEYVSKGYGQLWTEYEKEIDGILEGTSLVSADGTRKLRGDKAYIYNVVDMVFGRHAREAGIKFGGKDKGFFIESAGGDTGNLSNGSQGDGLTDAQRKMFNKTGVSSTDAAKTMKRMKDLGFQFFN